MTAGQQLGGGDMPLLSFPLGVRQDPVTGAPRITLAWRTEPHVPGSSGGGGADVPALLPAPGGSDDQQPATVAPSARAGALPAPKDTASADTGKAAAAKATQGRSGSPVKAAQLTAAAGGGGGQALTFSAGSPQVSARLHSCLSGACASAPVCDAFATHGLPHSVQLCARAEGSTPGRRRLPRLWQLWAHHQRRRQQQQGGIARRNT